MLHQPHHVGIFAHPDAVIEVQDADVSLAAIDARVCEQVVGNRIDRNASLCCLALHDGAHVGFSVARVVFTSLCPIAVATDVLQPIG